MGKLIRKTFPKIRLAIINGESLYQIDGRKQGPNGKRKYRKSRKDAEKRAQEIESDFKLEGIEGLTLSADLRNEALKADAKLAKHGKTLADAVISCHLPLSNDRGHLAEQMGNSIKMIKGHYKKIVKASDVELFWNILPNEIQARDEKDFADIESELS
jgi:hypothetical protein